MKSLFLALLISLSATIAFSQQQLSLNFGGTSQTNYYTELDYEDVSGKMIVKAAIGGKTYRFLFDTGAPNVISRKLYDQIKPAGHHLKDVMKIPVSDGGGRTDSLSILTLSGITLGNVEFNNVPTIISNDTFLFDCLKIDGCIGSNMLRNSIVQLSAKNHKIIVTDQPARLNLSAKAGTTLFLMGQQSAPVVEVQMTSKSSANIPMLFDTGSPILISLALAHYTLGEEHGVFTALQKTRGASDIGAHGIEIDTTKVRLRMPAINIQAAVFKNVTVPTTAGDDSAIGSDILKYGVVTLDYMNKKFYFDSFQPSVDLHEGMFPVTFALKDGKAVIGVIWEEQWKDKISKGDQILAVDDQDYSKISPCDFLLTARHFQSKTTATLKLKGGDGKIKKVTISKK